MTTCAGASFTQETKIVCCLLLSPCQVGCKKFPGSQLLRRDPLASRGDTAVCGVDRPLQKLQQAMSGLLCTRTSGVVHRMYQRACVAMMVYPYCNRSLGGEGSEYK